MPSGKVDSYTVAERASATRDALVAAARRLFSDKGYFATGTEEVVAAAGAGTRGALYHHFPSKRELFRAVFIQVEEEQLEHAAQIAGSGSAFEDLRGAIAGYIQASQSADVQQILLIEGPAALGWRDWRGLQEEYGLGVLRRRLREAIADGSLPDQPLDIMSRVLLAAINEAAMHVAQDVDDVDVVVQATAAVDTLLGALLKPAI